MICEKVPLLKDFETYKASLPVREVSHRPCLQLFRLPFHAAEASLDAFARRLADPLPLPKARSAVAYVAAAACSGKSASVLPGFLRAVELGGALGSGSLQFTHYLYMPFKNNDGSYHKAHKFIRPLPQDRAAALGAAYMRDCFRAQAFGELSNGNNVVMMRTLQKCCRLLQKGVAFVRNFFRAQAFGAFGGKHVIGGPTYLKRWAASSGNLPTLKTTRGLLQKDVDRFLQSSPKGLLLVHVDEHRRMSEDPDFRRGALSVLAQLRNVRVVATYVDIPPLPSQRSSATCCRYPVAKPIIDVKSYMESIGLAVPAVADELERLRLATLRVSCGLAVTELGLVGLHFKDNPVSVLWQDLNKTLNGSGATKAKDKLESAIEVSNQEWRSWMWLPCNMEGLVDLLCGIPETDSRVQAERYPEVVVALDGILTAPLEVLLRDEDTQDPANDLHVKCQHLFWSTFSSASVMGAGKLLDYAYLWALACKSKKTGSVRLGNYLVGFECEDVQAGRVFSGSNGALDRTLVQQLLQNKLYYADEGPGQARHPHGDIFFRTAKELVLVDVGGTESATKAAVKIREMNDTIAEESARRDLGAASIALRGILLLPNVINTGSLPLQGPVEVLTGAAAQEPILGGLTQLLAWLADGVDP